MRVNNYTRRTMYKPVPFQVVCRQAGMADVVYDGVWDINRQKGNLITVCTHTFTEATEDGGTAMSANSAARAKALNAEWMANVGEPTAMVATLDSLSGKEGVSVAVCGSHSRTDPIAAADASTVGRAFMDMAVACINAAAAKAPPGTAKNAKAFLSQRVKQLPGTVADLIAHLKAHPRASLSIHPRDHAPGYLVDIATKTPGVRKTALPAMLHFHDKHAYPVKPVAGTVGNARFDSTWLSAKTSSPRDALIKVKAAVEVDGACPFLALDGVKLPPVSHEAFPLACGFFPTDLSAAFHAHRERWAFCHTQMAPSMPPACMVPMVGTFLTGEASIVYLDGVKLTVKAR